MEVHRCVGFGSRQWATMGSMGKGRGREEKSIGPNWRGLVWGKGYGLRERWKRHTLEKREHKSKSQGKSVHISYFKTHTHTQIHAHTYMSPLGHVINGEYIVIYSKILLNNDLICKLCPMNGVIPLKNITYYMPTTTNLIYPLKPLGQN